MLDPFIIILSLIVLIQCIVICLAFIKIDEISKYFESLERSQATFKKVQDDQNIYIIKLIYHRALEIEDYEMLDRLKKSGLKVNYYKF
jgi:hypothetical protein